MNVISLIALAVSLTLGTSTRIAPEAKQSAAVPQEPKSDAQPQSTVVYVSDFELDVAPAKEEKSPPRGDAATAPGAEPKKTETAAEQAKRLVDGFSTNLVTALERAGYTVHRLRPGDPRPESGVRIQGVFVQVDEQSRLRKALIGSGLEPAALQLFFCISNLERPDQGFYEISGPKSGDNKFGPVITLSPYAPIAKLDVDREANDQALRDLSAQMVADLTGLLKANPMAASQ